MHSTLKKPGQVHPDLLIVSALAKHLLSPSERFENTSLQSKASLQDGLRCLATLDKPTRLSLPILSEPEARPASQSAVAPPNYGSHKQEYTAGLGDRTVVNALLEYHARKRPLGGGAQAPLSGFRATQATQVSAQPKSATRPEASHRHGTTRVFRSRGE